MKATSMKSKVNSDQLKSWRPTPTKVLIIESESGWGQKVDSTRDFPSFAAAQRFVKSFNSVNDKDQVPVWYLYARIEFEGVRR